MIAVADRYLDGLTSRDPSDVPLAPDVTRRDHGRLVADSADAIRAIIEREPVGRITSRRDLVDGDDVVVVYDLDTALDAADGPLPVYLAERFHVVEGQIIEIEPVYATDDARRPRPDRPARYPSSTPPRADVIGLSTAYLDALVSHRGSGVPLAPRAWRIENGNNSGDSGPEIAAALELDIMHVVAGIRDVRWFVEADTGIAFYTLLVDPTLMPGGPLGGETATRRIAMAERFRVHEGQVCEIEAVIGGEM
jgi:hypothetical protein